MRTGAKILVIDDERSIRRFMDASLTANGYAVLPAKTGAEGVKAAAEEHPDVVLLDLNLPDIDGLTAMRAIRPLVGPGVSLVAVSADASPDVIQRALDAGFDEFWTKPIDVRRLRQRLRDLGSEHLPVS